MSDGVRETRPRSEETMSARVDRYLDRELAPEEQAALFEALRRHPQEARRLAETQGALDALRRPVETPDLSGAILTEVGRRRGWLTLKLRQVVTVGRLAAAACLLLALTVVLTAKRAAPDAPIFQAGPAPVSEFLNAGQVETRQGVQEFRQALDRCRDAFSTESADVTPRLQWASNGGALFFGDAVQVKARFKLDRDETGEIRRPCRMFISAQPSGDAFRVVFGGKPEFSAALSGRGGHFLTAPKSPILSEDEASPVGGW